MTIDYDPYSHEAMLDPTDMYKEMRKEGGPHYIEKYNAWALTRFEDVLEASMMQDEGVTFTAGQTPGQVLLGEPVPHTFMTMDAPEHRKWRGLVRREYTPDGVKVHKERLSKLVKEVLDPLLDKGEMEVYTELANRVFVINAGYMLGIEREDAEKYRALIDGVLHREKGQVGTTSERNLSCFNELVGYLTEFVKDLRANPDKAVRHTKTFMEAEIDGKKLNDEDMVFYLFSLLVTGSETTPITICGTLYYLAQNPTQKAEVLADHSLIRGAFLETARYDQPTNMLARRAKKDIRVGNADIKEGQNLLFIYASANRDEEEFENPDTFDIHRAPARVMTWGAGGHTCLGLHLGQMVGDIIIGELLSAIGDYEVVEEECERVYGEHLSGFGKVTIKWDPSKVVRS